MKKRKLVIAFREPYLALVLLSSIIPTLFSDLLPLQVTLAKAWLT